MWCILVIRELECTSLVIVGDTDLVDIYKDVFCVCDAMLYYDAGLEVLQGCVWTVLTVCGGGGPHGIAACTQAVG